MTRFLLTLAIASIAAAPATARAEPIAAPPLTVADADRVVAVQVGQIVTVALPSPANRRPGWRLVPAAGITQLGQPMGDGLGSQIIRVRIAAPGDIVLTFVDPNSFGGPDQQATTATFVLVAETPPGA